MSKTPGGSTKSNNTNTALGPLEVETERETASSREEGEPDNTATSSLPTQQQLVPNNCIDNRSNDIKEEIQTSAATIGGSQHENQGKHDMEEEQLLNYPSTHCRMEFDLQAATTSLSQVSMSTPSFCPQQFEDKNGSNGNENDNDTYQVDPSDISSLTHLEEYNDNDLNNLLPFSTPMLTETPRNTTADNEDTELLSPDNCSDSSSSSESTRLLSPPLSPGPPNSSKHKTSRKDSSGGVRFQSEVQIIDGNVDLFDQQQQQQQQQQRGTLLWYSSEELTRMRERRIERSSSSLTTTTTMSPTCHLICNVLYKCIACQRE